MEVTDGRKFVAYMRGVRRRTLDVVSEVPLDREFWRLTPQSMSVPQILHHIGAVEKAIWAGSLRDGGPGSIDPLPESSFSMQAALAYAEESRAECEQYWSSLSPEDLSGKVATPTGHKLLLSRWLVLAAEHEIHHRGIIHAYRKLWELPSVPIYGLTYETLREKLSG